MTSRQRWILRLVTVACVMVARRADPLAQVPPDSGTNGRGANTAGAAVFDLAGLWEGTFALDSAWRLPERATARTTRARIQFSPVGDATAGTSSSRSVHRGVFEIDFSRFGFTLSTHEALGWSLTPDSLRAVLNPTVDHGLVEVHGRISGDSDAVGTWRYTSDPGGASGTFRLQRVRAR